MAQQPKSSTFKVIRIAVLLALVVIIVAMVTKPKPTATPLPAPQRVEQAKSFEAKLNELEAAEKRGESGARAQFTSDEVNSFLAEASRRGGAVPAEATGQTETEAGGGGESTPAATHSENPAPTESEVGGAPDAKDVQVAFIGDEVIAQAKTRRYGRDIYVTVRGRLGADHGYLKFIPTGFKIGNLTVPVSLVEGPLNKKLAEPETHEKLRLPPFVADLRIENGELVIVQK